MGAEKKSQILTLEKTEFKGHVNGHYNFIDFEEVSWDDLYASTLMFTRKSSHDSIHYLQLWKVSHTKKVVVDLWY